MTYRLNLGKKLYSVCQNVHNVTPYARNIPLKLPGRRRDIYLTADLSHGGIKRGKVVAQGVGVMRECDSFESDRKNSDDEQREPAKERSEQKSLSILQSAVLFYFQSIN
jgi:hypothetical protein